MAAAYLLRRMPHTFSTAVRVFTEIKFRMPLAKFSNFLDYGAGLGSGSYAFADTFPDCRALIASEPSTVMRKLGKHITSVKNFKCLLGLIRCLFS
jgi:ribosomal protein RSM22 (predicted rRNA methylase)